VLVESREELVRFVRDDRELILLAGEFSDGIERVEACDRHELDFVAEVATEELGPREPRTRSMPRRIVVPSSSSYASAFSRVVRPCQTRAITAQV
jgi:hypothetical protein